MRQVRWVPSCITAFGLLCGLFVIFKVSAYEGHSDRMVLVATLLLIVAGIADLLDGAVARAIHAETRFGLLFDSMSDAITFGVAPAIVALATLELRIKSLLAFVAIGAAMVYALCGVLRLVRFSLLSLPEDASEEPDTSHFVGLPIPAAAFALLSLSMLLTWKECIECVPLGYGVRIGILSTAMVLLAYLMVSRIPFASVKRLRWGVPSFFAILGTVVVVTLAIYSAFYFLPGMFLLLSWGYLIAAPLLAHFRKKE